MQKNGIRQSLRGMCVVTNDGSNTTKTKIKKYFTIELIGNKAITNPIVKAMKKKKNVIIQSGKDMLLFWKNDLVNYLTLIIVSCMQWKML